MADYGRWHRWFAWRPVRVRIGLARGRWVWLRLIERKIDWLPAFDDSGCSFVSYRRPD